jgi:hypothetical protein
MGEGRGRPDKLSNCRLIAKVRVSGVTGMGLNNGAALGGARRRGARKVPGKSHVSQVAENTGTIVVGHVQAREREGFSFNPENLQSLSIDSASRKIYTRL